MTLLYSTFPPPFDDGVVDDDEDGGGRMTPMDGWMDGWTDGGSVHEDKTAQFED